MRHKVKTNNLSRSPDHRKALIKNLARELVLKHEIITTQAKARSTKVVVEKLITTARQQTLHSRRQIHSFFNDKQTTSHLIDVIVPQLSSRTSGYTRIKPESVRRGDATLMVKLSLVDPVNEVVATTTKE